EVGRGLLLGRGAGGRVDHGLDAAQGVCQAFAGDDVDAGGAGDPDHLVSLLLEHVGDVAADPAGRPRYRDLSVCVHCFAPFSWFFRLGGCFDGRCPGCSAMSRSRTSSNEIAAAVKATAAPISRIVFRPSTKPALLALRTAGWRAGGTFVRARLIQPD